MMTDCWPTLRSPGPSSPGETGENAEVVGLSLPLSGAVAGARLDGLHTACDAVKGD